ncbi:hypothetical protein GALMADRAFT_1349893 [Galerina marginata CBS 339.88]|uniref:Uncharacterized protein n=1 Tax=Galerina marginata (strain CBS 339.88) TaxID=685588 RepID=A0A067SIA3_GALM3|nr:hypothetical protein GALMADRAFT_1349893 [Galerina marginata CBS 339.88]
MLRTWVSTPLFIKKVEVKLRGHADFNAITAVEFPYAKIQQRISFPDPIRNLVPTHIYEFVLAINEHILLVRCDIELGISGFCCPIGTSCFNHGADNIVLCIDAYGTTASSIPSATTGLVPSSTPILGSNNSITYSPAEAWGTSKSDSNCSTSDTIRTTSTINASIVVNYPGPSLMVHTVSSPKGGVFSVWVDGFDTSLTVDTFSGPGNESLPRCYPVQIPPFAAVPPGYHTRENHTVTLVFIGQSPDAPAGTNKSLFQFDAFAIPDPNVVLALTSNQSPSRLHVDVVLRSVFILFCVYATI